MIFFSSQNMLSLMWFYLSNCIVVMVVTCEWLGKNVWHNWFLLLFMVLVNLCTQHTMLQKFVCWCDYYSVSVIHSRVVRGFALDSESTEGVSIFIYFNFQLDSQWTWLVHRKGSGTVGRDLFEGKMKVILSFLVWFLQGRDKEGK